MNQNNLNETISKSLLDAQIQIEKNNFLKEKKKKAIFTFVASLIASAIASVLILLFIKNPIESAIYLSLLAVCLIASSVLLYFSRSLNEEEEKIIEENVNQKQSSKLNKPSLKCDRSKNLNNSTITNRNQLNNQRKVTNETGLQTEHLENNISKIEGNSATYNSVDPNLKVQAYKDLKIGYSDKTFDEAKELAKKHSINVHDLLNYSLLDAYGKNSATPSEDIKKVITVQRSPEGIALRNKIIRVAEVTFNDPANKCGYSSCYCLDQVAPNLNETRNLIKFNSTDQKYNYDEYLKQNIVAKLNLMTNIAQRDNINATIAFRAKVLGGAIFANGKEAQVTQSMLKAYKEALKEFPDKQKIIIDFNGFQYADKSIFNDLGKNNITISFSDFNQGTSKLNDPIQCAQINDKNFIFFTDNAGNIDLLPGEGSGLNRAWGEQSDITKVFKPKPGLQLCSNNTQEPDLMERSKS